MIRLKCEHLLKRHPKMSLFLTFYISVFPLGIIPWNEREGLPKLGVCYNNPPQCGTRGFHPSRGSLQTDLPSNQKVLDSHGPKSLQQWRLWGWNPGREESKGLKNVESYKVTAFRRRERLSDGYHHFSSQIHLTADVKKTKKKSLF